MPRVTFVCPTDADAPANGPAVDSLSKRRECFCVAAAGERTFYIEDKDYSCKSSVRHRKVRHPFVGSTVFYKRTVGTGGPVVAPREPPVIAPDTLESMSMQFSTLRRELSVAQALDPRLKAIGSCLRKEPAGSYLADPIREGFKVRARAAQYCLVKDKDGFETIMQWDAELDKNLPVVPDTLYLGGARSTDAPRRMTWKHVILGASHNIATGSHKNSKDMANDIKQLCAWQKPW